EMPVLVIAPPLRRRVPVHGGDRVELDRLTFPVKPVLDIGARDRGRALRSQGQGPATPVLERVHLLLDDVRAGTRGSLEERGVLERGCLDLPVAVKRAEPFRLPDDETPERLLGREDVVGAARRREARHELRSRAMTGLRASSVPSVVGVPWPE